MLDYELVWAQLSALAGLSNEDKAKYLPHCRIAAYEISGAVKKEELIKNEARVLGAAAVLALYYIYLFEDAEMGGEIKFEAGDVSVYQSNDNSNKSELKQVAYSMISDIVKNGCFCFRVV